MAVPRFSLVVTSEMYAFAAGKNPADTAPSKARALTITMTLYAYA